MSRQSDPRRGAAKRRYVRFTRWRRAHFFRVLGETGHAQMAAEAAGVSLACIYRLRRVEAGFTEKMQAAVAAADERLAGEEEGGQSLVTVPGALVVRRGRGGRLRVMAAGPRWWTERHDAAFFARLSATGNVAASARAIGFTPKTAWNRRERLPGFARAMDAARDDADLALEFALMVEAGRDGGSPRPGATADRDQAMRTLTFRHNRRLGRHAPPRRRPPPAIEEVAERIERKVRAIRHHRARSAPPPGDDEPG